MTETIYIKELNEHCLQVLLGSLLSSIHPTAKERMYILDYLIDRNPLITCILLIGNVGRIHEVWEILKWIRETHPNLKVMWDLKNSSLPTDEMSQKFFDLSLLDYIKLGNGPSTTYYEVLHYPDSIGILEPEHRLSDITYKFKNK